MDTGVLPWWTDEDILLSFWRPLAAVTHWLDYRVWPHSAVLMHAHSIVWFAAVAFAVALLYQRLLGAGWPAGLAALLYVLDENYYFPVAWITNRNALIALLFGILALRAHDRWRQRGSRVAAVGAALWLCASLLSAESGVAMLAYLVAYAAFIERGPRRQRALSLAPALAVVVVWLTVYHIAGFGARHSGLYVDPARSPVRFLVGVLERGPILLLGQLGWPPPEAYSFLSNSGQRLDWAGAVGYLALVLVILLPQVRVDRTVRFSLLATLLSVVPACAISVPSGRLLGFAGIGAMGLIARFTAGVLAEDTWAKRRRAWRACAWGLCALLMGLHLGLAAIGRVMGPMFVATAMQTQDRLVKAGPSWGSDGQTLVVVNAPSPFLFAYRCFLQTGEGPRRLQTVRVLKPAFNSLRATRTGAHTLVLRSPTGSLLTLEPPLHRMTHMVYREQLFNNAFREASAAVRAGAQVALTGLVIEVLDVGEDGLPRDVSYCFEAQLEHPSLRWVMWDWQTQSYVPFPVPAVGETVEIAGPS